jgi:NADPH:quinone reductase-like Zn-dependent oxidoreductase
MAHTHGNAFAEEVVVPADAAVPIPAAMDDVTAAAFPVAYGTGLLGAGGVVGGAAVGIVDADRLWL